VLTKLLSNILNGLDGLPLVHLCSLNLCPTSSSAFASNKSKGARLNALNDFPFHHLGSKYFFSNILEAYNSIMGIFCDLIDRCKCINNFIIHLKRLYLCYMGICDGSLAFITMDATLKELLVLVSNYVKTNYEYLWWHSRGLQI
jgi:hypothetical protein